MILSQRSIRALVPSAMRFAVGVDGLSIDRIDVYLDQRLIGAALPPDWVLDWREELTLRGETITAVGYAGEAIVDRTSIRSRAFGARVLLDVGRYL